MAPTTGTQVVLHGLKAAALVGDLAEQVVLNWMIEPGGSHQAEVVRSVLAAKMAFELMASDAEYPEDSIGENLHLTQCSVAGMAWLDPEEKPLVNDETVRRLAEIWDDYAAPMPGGLGTGFTERQATAVRSMVYEWDDRNTKLLQAKVDAQQVRFAELDAQRQAKAAK